MTETEQLSKAEIRRRARVVAHAKKYNHIVDQLILERAKKLSRSRWWPIYRIVLNKLLGYDRAVQMVDEAGDYPAIDAFEYVSEMLDMRLDISGMEHVPEEGAFLMALNHPSGIADGVAIYDVLKQKRPDMTFFANEDAVRLNQHLKDMIIAVPWRQTDKSRAKSRETLVNTARAFKAGMAVVLFPSGRIAFMDENKVLTEQPWMNSVAQLPKKYECPILPAHMVSRNSWLYYWFWNVNEELRDMTLFHELLNKKGRTFKITIGPPIQPDDLPEDNDVAAAALREYISKGLPAGKSWSEYKDYRPD
ncbi:MAG: 1-acyl-sn-glycerol-3-phosphate acyltransferase [Aquisalinus sp.]|nr:1-acyl-sn-glycerol-3-phosphate acyltransferase [Aquisalinus sp.]